MDMLIGTRALQDSYRLGLCFGSAVLQVLAPQTAVPTLVFGQQRT